MLEALKHMSEYDPEGAETINNTIWLEFATAASVSEQELHNAYARVMWDGYYGPVTDAEWEEAHGDEMPMCRAHAILKEACDYAPTIQYEHPDCGFVCGGSEECAHPDHEELGDDGPMFHMELVEIDPEDILRSMFPAIRDIYGGWL